MTTKTIDLNKMMADEWRQLGFYYDLDERISVNQWRFYGSRKGLRNFVSLLDKYTSTEANHNLSQHEHYGPYSYLKIMTWHTPIISSDYIAGTIEDLKNLKNIISERLNETEPGNTFNIDKAYGKGNTTTAKFFVMANDFDPVSMDELLVSGRQEIVNKAFQSNENPQKRRS